MSSNLLEEEMGYLGMWRMMAAFISSNLFANFSWTLYFPGYMMLMTYWLAYFL